MSKIRNINRIDNFYRVPTGPGYLSTAPDPQKCYPRTVPTLVSSQVVLVLFPFWRGVHPINVN